MQSFRKTNDLVGPSKLEPKRKWTSIFFEKAPAKLVSKEFVKKDNKFELILKCLAQLYITFLRPCTCYVQSKV